MRTETIIKAEVQALKTIPALAQAIKNVLGSNGKLENAIDLLRLSARAETIKLGYAPSDLAKRLKAEGISDGTLISEVVGWVYPRKSENRLILDQMLAHNCTNPNHRQWTKQEVLAVQRAKEGTTAEEERVKIEKAKEEKIFTLPTGLEQAKRLQTSQEQKARRFEGARQAEDLSRSRFSPADNAKEDKANKHETALRLKAALAEVLNAYAKEGYDLVDFTAEVTEVVLLIKPFTPAEEGWRWRR